MTSIDLASTSPVRADAPASSDGGAATNLRLLLLSLMLAVVAFLVLYPVLSLLATSFEVNALGQASVYGTEKWLRIFSSGNLSQALINTLSLSVMRQLIGVVVGIGIAWLIARTNLPGRNMLEIGFWVALFMPALPVTLAWVLLLAGRSGLANQLMAQMPFVHGPVFNAYSWWGIVWVHLMTSSIAVKVFLLVPAFRSLDSSLEEAARTSGATLFGTLRRVVVPIMAPTILVVVLISFVRSMQAFEVELILGAPKNISVYSTIIFSAMTREPPDQGLASALSIVFLISIVPFVILQQWYSHRHRYASISGKFRNRTLDLGRLRWPLFALIVLLLTMMTLLPFTFLLMATFMKMFGVFKMASPWTLDNWNGALSQGDVLRSLFNTLTLAVTAALAGMVAFTTIAIATLRAKFFGRRILDFLTWLPTLIPGLVLSLGFLQMVTAVPIFHPLYGSLAVMVLAILIGTMTIGTQVLRGALVQIGRELEEAAWAHGASRLYTFRRIVLPLIAPSVAVVGLEIFATANSAVGIIVLLGTGATQPLATLQLTLLDSGRFEQAAVIGVVIMTLTIASALLARTIGHRAGIGRRVATG
ncbi:MAG: ABC-type Fe3+ transport system permease component [Rhodospirillales bacterium]|jgi:iron(III) transport system permease protein|nr:ABC-type Fe3+ transport system permease component [Rhodospirillales bacterium]